MRVVGLASLIIMMSAMLILAQSDGEDYFKALQKKGMEQVRAFEEYAKKYPDTNATFTKYAHYWIAVGYYNAKQYGEAAAKAEKSLQIGVPEKYNEAMLFLVLANCHGLKDSPKYNLEQAEKNVDKAIAAARETEGASEIIKNALILKVQLSEIGNPISNFEKIQLMYFQNKYDDAISFYDSAVDSDKKNPEFFEVYGLSLYQLNLYDQAIEKVMEFYINSKKGVYASLLALIYDAKGEKDRAYLDLAADYHIQAGLLFGKEGKPEQENKHIKFAQFLIEKKYNFRERYDLLQMIKAEPRWKDYSKLIKKLERLKDKLIRDLDRKYKGMKWPDYEQERVDSFQKRINKLKIAESISNLSRPEVQVMLDSLTKDQQKIDAELKSVVDAARKKLGM